MAIVGVFFVLFLNSHWIGGQKFNFLDTQEAGYDEAHPLSPPKWHRKQYLSLQLFYYQYSFFVIILPIWQISKSHPKKESHIYNRVLLSQFYFWVERCTIVQENDTAIEQRLVSKATHLDFIALKQFTRST